jgi:hypothetical protein
MDVSPHPPSRICRRGRTTRDDDATAWRRRDRGATFVVRNATTTEGTTTNDTMSAAIDRRIADAK